jgi:hypothetical protein
MAFYAYNAAREAVQSIGRTDQIRSDGVGAYYAYDATHEAVQPINGLALGASASLSDNAIRGLFRTRPAVFVGYEWAKRVTDASWAPPSTRAELTLIPITDADITEVRRRAFGHEVPMVGVLSAKSPSMAQAETAFVATPYAFNELSAVYAVNDPNAVPTPKFLTTATAREAGDQDGGKGRLTDTARALGGVLVYIIALPGRGARQVPPIQRVLAAQAPSSGPALQPVPGAPPPPTTPNVLSLAGPRRRGFHQKGLLGVSTPAMLAGGLVVLIAGAVVVSAAMASGKA